MFVMFLLFDSIKKLNTQKMRGYYGTVVREGVTAV